MRKILSGLIALCLVSGVVLAAEVPGDAMKAIRDIQKGVNNKNQIEDLRVLDSATIGGAVTVAGALTAASVTSTGATVLPAGSVTNENLGASSVTGVKIANGTISNEDVSAAAGIAWSKLSNQGVVSNANIADGAVTPSKMLGNSTALALTNITVSTIPAANLAYDLCELTSSATNSYASVTLVAPGAALVGHRCTIYSAGTNSVTITADSQLESSGAMVLAGAGNQSITVIGNTAAKWLCIDLP